GALPFVWLPIWWFFISDHPRDAKWISKEERGFLDTTLQREVTQLEPVAAISIWERFLKPQVFIMMVIYFLHNCAAYGCMTFFTEGLKARNFSPLQYGLL